MAHVSLRRSIAAVVVATVVLLSMPAAAQPHLQDVLARAAQAPQALGEPPVLGLTFNDTAQAPGTTLVAGVTVSNPGGGPLADFLFVIVLPDGMTAVSVGPGVGAQFGSLGNLRSLVPVARNISLASAFPFENARFFSYTFTGNEPQGLYTAYFVALAAGALNDGALGAGDLLALASRTFSVGPGGAASVAVRVRALDGSALAAVDVRASSGATTQTDAQGQATLNLPANEDVTLAFSEPTLTSQIKVLRVPAGSTSASLNVTMIGREAPLTLIDIGVGGTVSGKDGVRAEFPAGSLVNAAGQVVTGAVQVQMTPVNVLSQTAAFPGRFAGTPTGGAAPVAIVSFGTAEFVPMQNGQKLQVAPGRLVTIEIPMYADTNTDGSAVRLGQVIPLWSLNESTGVWLQEGTGTVVASPSSPTGLALRASVSHFTWWNCDDVSGPKLTVDIRCLLLDAAGNPTVPMATGQTCGVVATVPDPARRPVLTASATVGPAGLQDLDIPANTVVELTATSVFGGQRLIGFTSVNFPPGGAARTVIIALVPPVDVNLFDPFPGATLPPAATASARAFATVDRVEMFLGGLEVAEGNNTSFQFAFDTSGRAEGFTTLQARAVRNNTVVGLSDAVPVVIDRTAPVVTLLRLNATAGNGQVDLLAQVSDLSRITVVEFFRGNTLIGQSTSAPFGFIYTLQPGDTPSVDFSAQARDSGGNVGTSNVISFGTLAPTVNLARSPATATIISSQTLTFTATAASNNGNGIARVEFFKGATLLGDDSSAPFEQLYTVTGADEPSFTMTAKAVDNAGITATASLSVPVDIGSDDTVAPVVALDPVASPVTNGALELAATATDNVGVVKVEFYVNGVFQGESTTPVGGRYRLPVDVSLLDGLTTFRATAFDAAGNPASSTQTATVAIVATLLVGAGDLLPHNTTACAPSLAFAVDGTPFVAHAVVDPSTGAFDARVSRRVANVWQSLGNANDSTISRLQEGQCPTIAIAAGDVPFVAFNGQLGRTGPGEIRQMVRRLNGVTWETVREIQATNPTDRIQVAADSAGRPVIVWSAIAPGSDHRLNVERFDGTSWILLAGGFGSLGGQGVGDYRFTVRPDGEVVVATFSGIGAGGQAVVAFRVNDSGASALGDASTRIIDQTGGSDGVTVLDVAADATQIVVAYGKFIGSQVRQTRIVRFNDLADRWDLVGSEADQLTAVQNTALAFQGGTLVQVPVGFFANAVDVTTGQARRFNGTGWSAFTSLQPVSGRNVQAVVRQNALFIVYTTPNASAGVARVNVP